ncbi:MAG: hypothetical protein ABH864_03080 [archaeon]
MDLVVLIVALPFVLLIILYNVAFSKKNQERIIENILSERDRNRRVFIEAKKYQYDKFDSMLQITLGVEVALLLGMKVAGFAAVTVYVIFSYVFVLTFLAYLGISKLHGRIIANLLLKKN